jgi:membrane protein
MPERRSILPLLAYGALGVITFSRGTRAPCGPPRETRSSRSANQERAQTALASEDGEERNASAPWEIPERGWKDILWRTYAKVNDNRLLSVAAGVVFYSLLALFPAVTAFVSL